MLQNYLTIALRNLFKNKVYSFLNIFGLAIGMAVAVLIGFWLHDELTYNKFHANYDRIGQVKTTQTFNGETGTHSAVAIPLSEELRSKYTSDFKYVVMTSWNFGHILAYGDKRISTQGLYTQPEFPEMMTLKMIKGSRNALKDPSSMLINASLAKSLFGDEDPMNKVIKKNNKTTYKIAGVFEDLPRNSEFYESSLLIPWEAYLAEEPWVKNSYDQWGNHSWQMFVQLNDKVDFNKVTAKIRGIPMQHLTASDGQEEVLVHPMSKWHLYSEFKDGSVVGGRIQFVWLFAIIGIFVLLLACINFMNLATARSEKRSKEVGIRKAVGSVKSQLVFQFLSESILVVFIAFFLAYFIVLISLPWFNELADKKMNSQWANPVFWLASIGFTLFTGLLAGSYPAFYLSSFNPVRVLKGTFKVGKFAALPRQVLVVLQFTVSVTLIIGTAVVFKQIQHAKNRPVGYNREGLISVSVHTEDLNGKYEVLRSELLKTEAVQEMAQSGSPTTAIYQNQIGFDWKGKDPNSVPLFAIVSHSHDYGKTINWQMLQGRDFSRDYSTDTSGLILNEAALKVTGLKNPVGETIKWNDKNWQIIGIIKDMVIQSPFRPIEPTIFKLDYGWVGVITIRLKPGVPVRDALAQVESVFKKMSPASPFDYKFTDEEYARKFSDEERIGTLASVFAGLAILISCLGLFGLASFTAEQRIKEIGIRKVLGASVVDLWMLLSKDFVRLVIISLLIAAPIAYYVMYKWLSTYDYRSQISWWIFAGTALCALLITLLTVSYQSIRAALANPVKSLRSE
ncbi:FtsX-like permease family protein [Rhodocytophaga rosea]|uniref:FtsX-like permease family protein n=1 Tax=Rhodocytophaga rosea TaxID=2704465 RepID=A0A6C0GMG9_9BACT|nr:ABC transporter permease [Rhodocytophaga rosea]QHT69219.1 FtsX-like permease family protein [Rhodocytophaga rosea]